MGYNPKRGATLVEAIMVMAIIGILSVGGAYLFMFFVQNAVVIPNQLNTDMAAAEILDIMTEGDHQAKGLRFSRSLVTAQDRQVSFYNQDQQLIQYELDLATKKIYRRVNGGPAAVVPYYTAAGIQVSAPGGKLFTYYRGNGSETSNPAAIALIRMDLTAMTGTGLAQDWDGQSTQSTAVSVHQRP